MTRLESFNLESYIVKTNDERENTLNQLLTEMDGFGTNHHVIVVQQEK